MIDLRPITSEDVKEIRNWPSYSDEFAPMDYALRKHGWLDEFMNRPQTQIYIADSGKQIDRIQPAQHYGGGRSRIPYCHPSALDRPGLGEPKSLWQH